MSLFDAGRTFLFSPSKIEITQNGKPLKNSIVVRRWEWKEEIKEDFSYTDEHGFAEFDDIRDLCTSQTLLVQFFVA